MKIPLVQTLGIDLSQPWKLSLSMVHKKSGTKYIDEIAENGLSNTNVGFCYYSHFGKKKNFKVGDHVLGFTKLREKDQWLLVTAGIVTRIPDQPGYCEYKPIDRLAPWCGRLVAEFKKGDTWSRYVFGLSKFFEEREGWIHEILDSEYSLFKFTGYADIKGWSFSLLERVVDSQRFADLREKLREISGVYYLLDTKTGRGYVGSAYGSDGLAQRWSCYTSTLTGGNKKLKELYEKEGPEYFKQNFRFSLLEWFHDKLPAEKIIERESMWKDALGTRISGYNAN